MNEDATCERCSCPVAPEQQLTRTGPSLHKSKKMCYNAMRAEINRLRAELALRDGAARFVEGAGYVSVGIVASRTGQSAETIRRKCRSGEIAARRIGRKWMIPDRSI